MDSTPAGLNTKTRLIRLPAMNTSGMWAHPTSLGFVGGGGASLLEGFVTQVN